MGFSRNSTTFSGKAQPSRGAPRKAEHELHIRLTVVLLAIHTAGGRATSAEPEPKNYVLFPIKTDLQRYLLFSTKADAYAQIDVAGCVQDKKFDLERLDVASFRKALTAVVERHGIKKPNLVLSFRYVDVSLDPDETKRMETVVTSFCRRPGFLEVATSMTVGGHPLRRQIGEFARAEDAPNSMESFQRYFRRRVGMPAPADAFLKEIGFESANYTVSPASVNPEALLGKRAPDFTLDALEGGQIHLHDMIKGRVALISFWGVACGPCRAEAPYLTALYNRFHDQGLAMVAVNAYDDSKPEVERFARAQGLTHPIALMGKKVAEEKYTATSYPVTFLVDHTGAIADHHLDFEPGDEKVLATLITRLLTQREKASGRN
jgi:peroxiredoxin